MTDPVTSLEEFQRQIDATTINSPEELERLLMNASPPPCGGATGAMLTMQKPYPVSGLEGWRRFEAGPVQPGGRREPVFIGITLRRAGEPGYDLSVEELRWLAQVLLAEWPDLTPLSDGQVLLAGAIRDLDHRLSLVEVSILASTPVAEPQPPAEPRKPNDVLALVTFRDGEPAVEIRWVNGKDCRLVMHTPQGAFASLLSTEEGALLEAGLREGRSAP